jgi:hypothetical protein
LPERLQHRARELGQLVEQQHTGSAGVLRGIPTIGRGCSGAIRGTNPLARSSRGSHDARNRKV